MTPNLRFRPILFALTATSSVYAAADPACERLKNLALDHAAIASAAFVEAASLKLPAGPFGKVN
jgi:hypothetical protein